MRTRTRRARNWAKKEDQTTLTFLLFVLDFGFSDTGVHGSCQWMPIEVVPVLIVLLGSDVEPHLGQDIHTLTAPVRSARESLNDALPAHRMPRAVEG